MHVSPASASISRWVFSDFAQAIASIGALRSVHPEMNRRHSRRR